MDMRAHSPTMTEMVRHALAFATQAHAGQTRKFDGRAYITHPVAVARLVARLGGDEAMVAAALLHDVIEDTGVTAQALRRQFGAEITGMVVDLTDVSRPEDGNRKVRKALDLAHSARACARAKAIKAADLAHNSFSVVAGSPSFARVYLAEKARLLEVLRDASHPAAVELAYRVHARASARLAMIDERRLA